MIWRWHDDGWRKRFAFFPIFLSDWSNKRVIWLQWFWKRDMGLWTEVRDTDPRDSDRHPEGGDGSSGSVHEGAGRQASPTPSTPPQKGAENDA